MATIEEKRNQKILEDSIESMKPSQEGQRAHNKRKEEGDAFVEYADRFFAALKADDKKQTVSINASTMQMVKNVLFYLQENVSMASYIENIVLSHFADNRDLLNDEVGARVKPQIIPENI